jgi:hypothetical protein
MLASQHDRLVELEIRSIEGAGARLRRGMKRLTPRPLDQLRGLPRVTNGRNGSGIYFLWWGPQLLYIGQSVEVGYRIQQHRKQKDFTHATWLMTAEECLRRAEQSYVTYHRPILNRTNLG